MSGSQILDKIPESSFKKKGDATKGPDQPDNTAKKD